MIPIGCKKAIYAPRWNRKAHRSDTLLPIGCKYAVANSMHVHDLHATMLHLLGFDHERFTYRYASSNFSATAAQRKHPCTLITTGTGIQSWSLAPAHVQPSSSNDYSSGIIIENGLRRCAGRHHIVLYMTTRKRGALARSTSLLHLEALVRFSIKWLLGIAAYVALGAAAIGSDSALLADATWAATFLAFTYAVVVACVATNRRRAVAMGFAIVAAANFACLYVAPDRLPAARVLPAFGYLLTADGILVVESDRPSGSAGGRLRSFRGATSGKQVFRTANALGTMLAGLVGCAIGAIAYKEGS